jgi:hypothetical protein
MKTKVMFDPRDLTKEALVRLVQQLSVANDEEEAKLMKQLAQTHKESSDLADLTEEKRGKPNAIDPMDDDEDEDD